MSNDKNCGNCAVMRPSDGYCKTTGQYVNALAVRNCFVPKEELAELKAKPLPVAPKLPKEKTCKACGRTLPLDDFPSHNTSRDKHDGVCKECKSKQMTAANEARARRLEAAIGTDKNGNEVPEGMRRCKKCGRVLPLTEFGHNKKCQGGLQYECKDCRNKYGRALYHSHYGGNEVPMRHRHLPENPGMMTPLTDEQMVEALRSHGWTVVCTREEKL